MVIGCGTASQTLSACANGTTYVTKPPGVGELLRRQFPKKERLLIRQFVLHIFPSENAGPGFWKRAHSKVEEQRK